MNADPASDAAAQPPDAGLWNWRVHTHDVDAHARAQPHWRLHYEQLSPGRFEGLVHHVQLPLMRLVHEWCSVAVRQRGQFVQGRYGFAMALDGAAAADGAVDAVAGAAVDAAGDVARDVPDVRGAARDEPVIFNGQRVDRDGVMLGRHGELDLCTPAGYALIAVVVDAELLVPLWEHLYGRPPSSWIESQLVVPARPAVAESLRRMHMTVLGEAAALLERAQLQGEGAGAAMDAAAIDGASTVDTNITIDLAAAQQLRDSLLIEWIEALPSSIDTSGLPTALHRKRIVDRACEVMLGSADEPLSMLEVCRRVGASRRKLNYCFQDVLATSPVKYLRAVRLNGVRRELLGDAPTVVDAAVRWGFWHLGQFSRDYKRQFGELPSATLRSRGGARAGERVGGRVDERAGDRVVDHVVDRAVDRVAAARRR